MITPTREKMNGKPWVKYEWSWKCLSLFRNYGDGKNGGGSARVFTLKPKWVYQFWREWILYWLRFDSHPDPYIYYIRFERDYLREHPDCEDAFKAFCNRSNPGTLLKLQPKLFK